MPKTVKVKRSGLAVEIKTFRGDKATYLVMRTGNTFHVFAEVEAKAAATDCGCPFDPRHNHMHKMWRERFSATKN
jgi:hypothetical protein